MPVESSISTKLAKTIRHGRGRENRMAPWSQALRNGRIRDAFDILFAEPDRMSPRNVVQDIPESIRSPAQLADNDEILPSNQRKTGRSRFALSNNGNRHPQVKAGFAYTGESPSPPRLA